MKRGGFSRRHRLALHGGAEVADAPDCRLLVPAGAPRHSGHGIHDRRCDPDGTTLLALPLGAAVVLGAVLAPTDPVLASEVQVRSSTDRDSVRHALSGEAGLNDGLAFPFVVLGLGLLGLHPDAKMQASSSCGQTASSACGVG